MANSVTIGRQRLLELSQQRLGRIKSLMIRIPERGQFFFAFVQKHVWNDGDDVTGKFGDAIPLLNRNLKIGNMFEAVTRINRILTFGSEWKRRPVVAGVIDVHPDRPFENRSDITLSFEKSSESDVQNGGPL